MARRIRTLLLFAAGGLAATAVFEAALRLVEATPLWRVLPVAEVSLYAPDAETGYRHRAGAAGVWLGENRARIAISALGLRDRARPAAKPAGGLRLAVIGDSIVEALQVDNNDTAVSVAERRLAVARPGAELLNLGLAGASPAVQVALLRPEAPRLGLDGAILLVSAADLLAPAMRSDGEYPGYTRQADGAYALTHRFRDGRAYRFRVSAAGRFVYAVVDRVAVARVLNARRHFGLLAEWPRAPAPPGPDARDPWCRDETLAAQRALWERGEPGEAGGALAALLADLGALSRARGIPVVLAFRGFDVWCQRLAESRAALIAAAKARVEAAGLGFVDFEARAIPLAGGLAAYRRGFGFGARRGGGHLNEAGHAVFGAVLAEIAAGLRR
jgi:hypothetical protein